MSKFVRIDNFSEKYSSLSPYQYALNNPIGFIDINGDSTVVPDFQYSNGYQMLSSRNSTTSNEYYGAYSNTDQKSTSQQIFDGISSGMKDLADALVPMRPATDSDPKSLSEWWENLKNAPGNVADVYSEGSLEDKTRLTVSLLGIFSGKSNSVTGVVIAGSKSSKLLYFGRLAVNRDVFHKVLKREIFTRKLVETRMCQSLVKIYI